MAIEDAAVLGECAGRSHNDLPTALRTWSCRNHVREDGYDRSARNRQGMSESNNPGATELKELMRRVIESDASEAFEQFMVRQIALRDMAPSADDAVLKGVEDSPDGGAAMAEAHLLGLPDHERDELLERAGGEAGRRLQAAASALLAAVGAGRLPVDVTPEMVAVAAITELGDSVSGRREQL
jgi:hypothetical protein